MKVWNLIKLKNFFYMNLPNQKFSERNSYGLSHTPAPISMLNLWGLNTFLVFISILVRTLLAVSSFDFDMVRIFICHSEVRSFLFVRFLHLFFSPQFTWTLFVIDCLHLFILSCFLLFLNPCSLPFCLELSVSSWNSFWNCFFFICPCSNSHPSITSSFKRPFPSCFAAFCLFDRMLKKVLYLAE